MSNLTFNVALSLPSRVNNVVCVVNECHVVSVRSSVEHVLSTRALGYDVAMIVGVSGSTTMVF